MTIIALTGAAVVLPDRIAQQHAVLVEDGKIADVVADSGVPDHLERHELGGGWLLPGFVDTQVNGGGDVLFNDRPDVHGIASIAHAHRRFGTTAMLPTLISDDAAVVDAAIAAVEQALAQGVAGVLGIHVEGPHLNEAKRGIHDASKFTALTPDIAAKLAAPSGGVRLVTLAPELVAPGVIADLAKAGVIVAGGHSLADYEQTNAALRDGLRGFTHLFNAMTQLGSRDPGMVGAALDDDTSWFGIIVDGVHVHPATLRIALAARGIVGAMLVTDAMPPVGGTKSEFVMMGQHVSVIDGTCRGPDGTLAGSALTMAQAFRNAMSMLHVDIATASRLASGNPASFLGLRGVLGAIEPGLRADLVHLNDGMHVVRTWIGGDVEERGER